MPLSAPQRSIFEYALVHLQTEKAKLDSLIENINAQLGGASPILAQSIPIPSAATKKAPRRRISAEGKARIAEAQRKRWEAIRKAQKVTTATAAKLVSLEKRAKKALKRRGLKPKY
jgi:hypothetical protein